MEFDRDMDQVLMNIRGTATGMASAFLVSANLSLKMLVFFMRMAKKGLVAAGMTDRFKAFLERTEGNYTVYNIPMPKERVQVLERMNALELELEAAKKPLEKRRLRNEAKDLQKQLPELEQLDKLGLTHYVMPKINGSSQTIQVAIDKRGDQTFKNWFLNHLEGAFSGGEKSQEEMKVFTEGNYTIFNFPFEGTELDLALQDFQTLGLNYSVLPDLHVGDNYRQVAIPNAERGKLESWFGMWKEKQLREGKEPGELCVMDQEGYLNTGQTTVEEYVANADVKYREANEGFERLSMEPPWKATVQKEGSEEYVSYLKNGYYERVPISKNMMAAPKTVGGAADKKMEEKGFFVFRIPGTSGDGEKKLIVPKEQVFQAKEGGRFLVFLPKNIPCMVGNETGGISTMGTADVCRAYAWEKKGAEYAARIQRGMEPNSKPAVTKNRKASSVPPVLPKGAVKANLPPVPKL